MAATIIRNFIVRDRNFVIVKNEEDFYLAIEDKYIDNNGRLNTTLNGFQMYANKDLNDCLNTCKHQVEIEYLESQGYSKAEAFAIEFNIPLTEEFKKAFS